MLHVSVLRAGSPWMTPLSLRRQHRAHRPLLASRLYGGSELFQPKHNNILGGGSEWTLPNEGDPSHHQILKS